MSLNNASIAASSVSGSLMDFDKSLIAFATSFDGLVFCWRDIGGVKGPSSLRSLTFTRTGDEL